MTLKTLLARSPIDPYIVAIVVMVGIASIMPAHGDGAVAMNYVTNIAIALLFFLYGARLSPQAALAGARHWRLHILVLLCTFVLFPVLGLAAHVLVPSVLTPQLYFGLVFLCALPSTVQSSIAFTSIARGNVAAALCSASASNLIGILLTPLLVSVLLSTQGGGFSLTALKDIVLQLLVPFAAGQLLRPWIAAWTQKHKYLLGFVDRGSILLVVYTAFSEGVVAGIWHQLSLENLAALLAVNMVLLVLALVITTAVSRSLGFSREDEIAIVFCGSKKSLASGLPMASVLFAGQSVGLIVLPLMLFHQIQLMACAVLARWYAQRTDAPVEVRSEA
ncbi:MAG TPA: bile acid:sodium symporter family protein [Stellaceae bacterium]|nr:bile acid:sodium symporter family protein [Stellaceae bacterium]